MATFPPMPPNPPQIPIWIKKINQTLFTWLGWRVDGQIPNEPKMLLVVAPHTSNWDFLYMLLCLWSLGIRASWMAKASLFKWPFGPIMRWLGGIPIDRSKSRDVVGQTKLAYESHERLFIGILPEGTRSKRDHWKTGFYYISQAANVPLLLTCVDYEKKLGMLGPVITPSGDIQQDMVQIRAFYTGAKGKYPEKFSDIRIRKQS